MVIVLVSDDDGYDLAKEVSGELLGELHGVDKNSLIGLFDGKT